VPTRSSIKSDLLLNIGSDDVVGQMYGSLFDTVSYMAERYLVVSNGLLAQEMGGDKSEAHLAGVDSGELWLAALKS
jgi:hypothetical protein